MRGSSRPQFAAFELNWYPEKRDLVLDLLSVHLIREKDNSTIISYHPSMPYPTVTEANYLRDRIRYAGQSVYWQLIFQDSPDPTFVLLTYVWHALYAWDEALEHLYNHICWLVSFFSRVKLAGDV